MDAIQLLIHEGIEVDPYEWKGTLLANYTMLRNLGIMWLPPQVTDVCHNQSEIVFLKRQLSCSAVISDICFCGDLNKHLVNISQIIKEFPYTMGLIVMTAYW